MHYKTNTAPKTSDTNKYQAQSRNLVLHEIPTPSYCTCIHFADEREIDFKIEWNLLTYSYVC